MRFFGTSEYDDADGSYEQDIMQAEYRLKEIECRIVELEEELTYQDIDIEEAHYLRNEINELEKEKVQIHRFLGTSEW
jgi:hypothetical protein